MALACPSTRYAIHANDDLVAVTTTDTRFGVRAAVILKLLTAETRRQARPERRSLRRAASTERRTRSTPASTRECASAGCNRRGACSRRRSTSSCVRFARDVDQDDARRSTPSSSSTWTPTDGAGVRPRHLHARPRGPPPVARARAERYPASPGRCSTSSTRATVRGTFFVVGEIAEAHPDLVREVAARGHEIGLHGWRHVPLTELDPEQFRDDVERGKALLEDLGGTRCSASARRTFSLVPESRWAVDVLAERGFTYSSSVLPGAQPAVRRSRPCPPRAVPLAQRAGRAPVPGRSRRRRRAPLPRRRLPARAPAACASTAAAPQRRPRASCSGSTATRTTSTPTRRSGSCPRRVGSAAACSGTTAAARSPRSRRCSHDRRGASARRTVVARAVDVPRRVPVDRVLAARDGAPAPAGHARRPLRLPPRARRRAGASCTSASSTPAARRLNEQSGAWLHEHLARTAAELVGLDLDEPGVDDARARGLRGLRRRLPRRRRGRARSGSPRPTSSSPAR